MRMQAQRDSRSNRLYMDARRQASASLRPSPPVAG